MINILYALIFALILLISNYLTFNYALRIGKALQQDIPALPLAEPIADIVDTAKKICRRKVKLVSRMDELKVYQDVDRSQGDIWGRK